ncbi:FAD:protein FMN transferase [Edaphobacter albus]|uniref:FAD:protein FMN transferase n=1 Tax=Edaphobacter sp. 4G125 TaxID=2763071 RepID=UPI0016470742|nr:FAD:protein FMN transferase [Edaphobacter sp. 4G125]QNI35941.1 FAD:protein FMN transferase [Edaphobacter sp. 4G125]
MRCLLRAAGLAVGIGLLWCEPLYAQDKPQLFHEAHAAMGSEFTIDIYAPNQETAEEWMQGAFDEIDRLEDLLSNYRPTSELSRISREAAKGPVTTDPETFAFLEKAVELSRRSEGAFDMTVGPLMRAWGFFFNKGRIPSDAELDALRSKTGWQHIQLNPATRTVWFDNGVSMELDPGGIGKGYAVDRVVAFLREQGVRAALISGGSSSIYGMGAPPGEAGWKVNVPDPVHAGSMMTEAILKDTSLSTSACTEKFFIKDGHRYCHILDPHTMHPVEGRLQTTIIAPSTTESDAISTATFVLEPAKAAQMVKTFQRAAAVLVSGDTEHPCVRSVRWPYPLRMKENDCQ